MHIRSLKPVSHWQYVMAGGSVRPHYREADTSRSPLDALALLRVLRVSVVTQIFPQDTEAIEPELLPLLPIAVRIEPEHLE